MSVHPHLSVMIVDNNEYGLSLSRCLVEKAAPSAEIVTACGAGEAIAHLLRASDPRDGTVLPPDVVLLDVNLPGVDGFELLRWIRRNQSLAAVKVVMLSSSDTDADFERAIQLGAHGYLIKFPSPSDLAHLFEHLLNQTNRLAEIHRALHPDSEVGQSIPVSPQADSIIL